MGCFGVFAGVPTAARGVIGFAVVSGAGPRSWQLGAVVAAVAGLGRCRHRGSLAQAPTAPSHPGGALLGVDGGGLRGADIYGSMVRHGDLR